MQILETGFLSPANSRVDAELAQNDILIVEDDRVRLLQLKLVAQSAKLPDDTTPSIQVVENFAAFKDTIAAVRSRIYLLDCNIPRLANDASSDYLGEEMLESLLYEKGVPADHVLVTSNDTKFHRYAAERGCPIVASEKALEARANLIREIGRILSA